MKRSVIVVRAALVIVTIIVGMVVWIPRGGVSAEALPALPIVSTDHVFADADVRSQVADAQQTVDSRPLDAQANGRLGMLYEIYQLPEAALVCFERAALIKPTEFRWQFYLGRSQRQLGQLDAAIETLGRALEMHGRDGPALVLLGDAYVEFGSLDDAETAFRSALAVDPSTCSPLLGLGQIAAHRGDHGSAIAFFEQALAIAPLHAPIHYALGLSYRALNDTDQAQRHLGVAAAGSRVNPDPNPLVGEMFELETGIPADTRNAIAAMSVGRIAEAVAILRSVLSRDPDNSGAYALIGQCYMHMGRNAEALTAIDRAFGLAPLDIGIVKMRGGLLLQVERSAEAVVCLEQVLQLGGQTAQDLLLLGQAYLQNQQRDKAITSFEQALAIDGQHAQAREALDQLRSESSKDPGEDH